MDNILSYHDTDKNHSGKIAYRKKRIARILEKAQENGAKGEVLVLSRKTDSLP